MFGFLTALLLVSARADFQVPALTGPVMDLAGMISPRAESGLDELIRRVKDSGGTQLQILTVLDLGGLSIEEASIKVTDQWKLGSAKDDNGVLLMVAAKERRVRIEVGQGREGVLPDITASRIIREVIIPRFRQNDSSGAITAGVFAILHYTDPSFSDEVRPGSVPSAAGGDGFGGDSIFVIILFIFAMFLSALFNGGGRRRRSFWGGPGGLGGWGGGGFGGGGFGGGGGWSGGGGGFSGGGASGGW